MGCSMSAHSKKHNNRNENESSTYLDDNEGLQIYSERLYDQKTIANLKREFKEDLEIFILNNMLLSVMFFENYDVEMAKAKNMISKREKELNLKLMTDHKKQCIMPDTAVDMVNQRIRYCWRHGPKKDVEEALVPQRMYIVYDTMEIIKESEDLNHYSDVDKPTYRAHLLKSNHPGFVKLKYPEYRTLSGVSNSSLSSGIFTDTELNDAPTPTAPIEESSEYEYATFNQARTLRPLSQDRLSNGSNGFPPHCIKAIKEKNFASEDSDDLFIIQHYFDSSEFMQHFTNQVFPGKLGRALGFSQGEIYNATYNSRAVYCDTEHENGLLKCEVIPVVQNLWPSLNVWANRTRPIVKDMIKSIMYQWPTANMVQEMLMLPAAIVPRGFLQKRGQNPDYNFEWELCHPKAEKYMHMRMSHAQMKCYLFAVTLHKTFIEPLTQEKGLLLDHLRMAIYWECEKNFRDWPENRLGEKMLRIFRIINGHLGRRDLRDYFIENKNILQNVPGPLLLQAQQQIHNICERPVAHFIGALRNLNYMDNKFYPMLDFDKLYKILTERQSMNLINPTITKSHVEEEITGAKLRKLNQEQLWVQRQLEFNTKIRNRKEEEQKNLTVERRESVDSVDLKWTSKHNVDGPKAVIFIKFFIEHFISVAKYSMRYHRAVPQALLYLKHAWYLTQVMEDPSVAGEIYSKELQTKIEQLEVECKEMASHQALTPTTPARNSRTSINQIQIQIIKNATLDLNNINQQYQNGLQKPPNSVQKPTASKSWVEQNAPKSTMTTDTNRLHRRSTKVRINSVVDHMS